MSATIEVTNVSKNFRVHVKQAGLLGSVKGLFKRQYQTVEAVRHISLSIAEGELIGFIGPNGAGKTTTLKMLAGLLHPSEGEIRVLGYTPFERSKEYLKQCSLVMGQKQQLWWDLPLIDSLLLQRDMYEMTQGDYERNLEELTQLLDLQEFLNVQVRKLSLGQRMRAELAAALLYEPKVLFLDEPTIGLDVVVQKKIREFIAAYNQKHSATIILTSHYLDDVRQLCKRVVIIDHGTIAFDGSTDALMQQHVDHKQITLTFDREVTPADLTGFGKVLKHEDLQATIQVKREETSQAAAGLLAKLPVTDIAIEEPDLEDVVRELFSKKDYA
jgi:ABC-2 type transport system ATP-binding protein